MRTNWTFQGERRARIVASICVAALCWAGTASAQEDGTATAQDDGTATAQKDDGWKTKVWTGFEFQGETDLDEGGDFEFWLVAVGADLRKMMNEKLALSLKGDYRAIGYDFSNSVSRAGDPWETVHVARLNPTLTVMFNDHWSLMGGPIFELSAEGGADVGDSLRGGGSLAVGYKHSDRFSIALGALVQSEIEDDAYVQPIVVVNWGITDGLRLSMEGTSSRGGEIQLGYTFADHWLVAVGGGFRRERFRLNDDSPGIRKDGVGEEEATVATARVGYTFDGGTSIQLYAGTTIDGEFRLEDDDGDKLADSDYDNSAFGGVQVVFAF